MIDITITPDVHVGDTRPLLVMSGPCVIESEELCLEIAKTLKSICTKYRTTYVFKASFDKANRTSVNSFRGPGLVQGLEILRVIKDELNIPVVTDVHECHQVDAVAGIVDILQIPAFLCRQTDLLLAAGKSGRTVNIKKGQFMAPHDMRPAVEKVMTTGNKNVILTERGHTFGYHNLVVDMRSLVIMRSFGVPVVFDATHSVQLPGGQGATSGGQREFVPHLTRAALAVGIDGIFLETHPRPESAKSDGTNSMPLSEMEEIIRKSVSIHECIQR